MTESSLAVLKGHSDRMSYNQKGDNHNRQLENIIRSRSELKVNTRRLKRGKSEAPGSV